MLPVEAIYKSGMACNHHFRTNISRYKYIYKEKKKRRNKILLIVAIERFQRGEKEGERGGRCSGVVGIA